MLTWDHLAHQACGGVSKWQKPSWHLTDHLLCQLNGQITVVAKTAAGLLRAEFLIKGTPARGLDVPILTSQVRSLSPGAADLLPAPKPASLTLVEEGWEGVWNRFPQPFLQPHAHSRCSLNAHHGKEWVLHGVSVEFFCFGGVFLEHRAVLCPREAEHAVRSKASKVGALTVALRLLVLCLPCGWRVFSCLSSRAQETPSQKPREAFRRWDQFQDLSLLKPRGGERHSCPGMEMGESLNPLRRGWGISGSSAGSLRFSWVNLLWFSLEQLSPRGSVLGDPGKVILFII